jgi:hypothetical protein
LVSQGSKLRTMDRPWVSQSGRLSDWHQRTIGTVRAFFHSLWNEEQAFD